MVRAVLFDLDGTLVDSLEDLTDAVNHIRGAFAHGPLSVESVRLKVGKGARHLVQQVLPDLAGHDIDRALGMFLEYNRLHIADKSRLYPGIAAMLRALAAQDLALTVISNKNEDLCALILQALDIHSLFARICGGDTYPANKPSPLPVLGEIEALGYDPEECVMVGDSSNDIQAGREAGVRTIACTWGYGGSAELAGADYFAHAPHELPAIIVAGAGKRP